MSDKSASADGDLWNRVHLGSAERMPEIPGDSIHACVTSPPYFGLRDYGVDGQIGREPSLEAYVARLVGVFREVRRVLRPDGTLWLNLGDCYAPSRATNRRVNRRAGGFKEKDQMLVPHAVAMALRADGWWLRDTIVWHKPNRMPSSVTDRTTLAHEYVFLLTKNPRYFYDQDAIREPLAESSIARLSQNVDAQKGSTRAHARGKTNGAMKAITWQPRKAAGDEGFIGANARSVWSIPTEPYTGEHSAIMPRELARRCILAGSPKDGIILDPFMGTGTTAEVAIGLRDQSRISHTHPGPSRSVWCSMNSQALDIIYFDGSAN
jgi:DNA modification methylase